MGHIHVGLRKRTAYDSSPVWWQLSSCAQPVLPFTPIPESPTVLGLPEAQKKGRDSGMRVYLGKGLDTYDPQGERSPDMRIQTKAFRAPRGC